MAGTDVNLDRITISVNVEDNGSATKLKNISGAVDNLSNASSKLENLNTDLSGIEKLASALGKLKDIKVSATIGKNLTGVASAIEKVNDLGPFENIDKLATSVSKLNGVTVSKTLATNLPAVVNALASLNNVVISPELAKTLEQLGSIKVSTSIANNIEKIGLATKTLTDVDFTKLRELVDALSQLKGMGDVKINIAGLGSASAVEQKLKKGDNGKTSKKSRTVTQEENDAGNKQPDGSKAKELAKSWESVKAVVSKTRAVFEAIKSVISTIVEIGKKIYQIFAKVVSVLGKVAKGVLSWLYEPFIKTGKAVSNIVSKVKDLGAMVKRLALHRLIRELIKLIGEGITTGIKNLYDWSKNAGTSFSASMDKIATSLTYLKNSIGAMVSPLINAVAPAIDYIIDKAVDLLNVINQLFAKLSGATSWTKAVKKATAYADATGSAAKNTEKLKRSLLAIDEIHALNNNDTSSGSGGSSSGTDTSGMFEQVNTFDLSEQLGSIWDVFAKSWNNEGQTTIESVKTAFESLKTLAGEIGISFKDVFTNGTGQTALETILRTVQNISGTVTNLATNFTIAWKSAGVGTSIVQGIFDIVNLLLEKAEKLSSAFKSWSADVSFSSLLKSIDKLINDGFKPLIKLIDDNFIWIWDNILLPFSKWVIEDAAPKSITIFTNALETLKKILTPISEGLKEAWDNSKELRSTLKELADDILNNIAHYLENIRKNLSASDIQEIKKAAQDLGQTALTYVAEQLKTIDEFVTEFLNNDGASQIIRFIRTISSAIETAIDVFILFAAGIRSTVDALISLAAVMGGDYETAMEYVGKSFTDWTDGFNQIGKLEDVFKSLNGVLETTADRLSGVKLASKETRNQWADDLSSANQKLEQFDSRVKKTADNVENKSSHVYQTVKDDSGKTTIQLNNFGEIWNYCWDKILGKTIQTTDTAFVTDIPKKAGAGIGSISALWGSLFSNLNLDLGKIPSLFSTAFSGGATSISKALGNGGSLQAGIISGTNSAFKSFLNSMIKGINTAMNSCFSRLKNAIDKLKKISILGKQPFANLPTISIPYIPQLASGGMVSSGQMFIANESGPELVGKFGKQTGVMNNDQIVKSVADGVASANESQNSLLREQNNLLRQLLSKDADVRAYITTGDLVTGIQSMNKRTGRQVIPLNI